MEMRIDHPRTRSVVRGARGEHSAVAPELRPHRATHGLTRAHTKKKEDECCVVLYVVSVSTVLAFLRARARVIYPHLHTQITSCTGPNGSPAGARWFLSFTMRHGQEKKTTNTCTQQSQQLAHRKRRAVKNSRCHLKPDKEC